MTNIIDVDGYWTIELVYDVVLDDTIEGFTKTDMKNRRSIVVLSNTYSLNNFINTIVHEAKHVQSHICEYYNVPENGEQAAYLIAYIVTEIFKVLDI